MSDAQITPKNPLGLNETTIRDLQVIEAYIAGEIKGVAEQLSLHTAGLNTKLEGKNWMDLRQIQRSLNGHQEGLTKEAHTLGELLTMLDCVVPMLGHPGNPASKPVDQSAYLFLHYTDILPSHISGSACVRWQGIAKTFENASNDIAEKLQAYAAANPPAREPGFGEGDNPVFTFNPELHKKGLKEMLEGSPENQELQSPTAKIIAKGPKTGLEHISPNADDGHTGHMLP